ncbi:MAG TPA: hypothetical protein VFP68_07235 [Burkholderiaceae bacterium]|nr:hypothetical protein [Burkholderiaceae bacterium]
MMLMAKAQSSAWTPVLVEPALLETYWRHGNYWPTYGWPPVCRWFDRFDGSRPGMFNLGVAYFSTNREQQQAVFFNNGRHRARWLLESKAREVVVALANENINAAVEVGLVIRVLQQREVFDLGFELDAGAMLHRAEPGHTCAWCDFPVPGNPTGHPVGA